MSKHVAMVFGLFVSLAMFLGVVAVATGGGISVNLAAVVVWVGLFVAVGLGFVLMGVSTR
ncbi:MULTISPECIES: hypothetical protein [Halorussus]|uniref:hypothetical protein n=1 Tax=Halorussus TaxID=1070314 RepID=UPI00209D3C7C|nr:hypothetical protein [Halorussus vallis]USZ74382.1 hypothetical protein NGM07_13115 [Halorussus vallis]